MRTIYDFFAEHECTKYEQVRLIERLAEIRYLKDDRDAEARDSPGGCVMNMGYEQGLLLVYLANSDMPELEMSSLCLEMDCSWDEVYRLHDYGFLRIRADEENQKLMLSITSSGMHKAEDIQKERRSS